MRKSILTNYVYSILFKLLDVILPIITTPYLARILGKTGVGVYAYTNSIVTFFVLLASAGINIYGQREIAYVQNDVSKRSNLFWQICILRVILFLITGIVYWILFAMGETYSKLYQILFLLLISNALDISWFFQGMEDFRKTAVRNAIIRLSGVAMVFIFVKGQDDLLVYAAIVSLTTLLGNGTLWLYLPQYLTKTRFSGNQLVRHIRPIFTLFIPQLAIEIYTVLDKTMLGSLGASIEEVAFYEQAQKIVKLGLRFITALGSVMLSRVSNAYAEEGEDGIQRNIAISFRFAFFLGIPVFCGTIGIAGNLVPWFYGAGYEPVSLLIVLISPIIICIGLSNIIGMQYLIPTKQQGLYSISVIGGAVFNCFLNWALIPKWNAIGASIASVCAEGLVVLIQVLSTRKKLPYLEYMKFSWKNWLSGFIMLALVIWIGQVLPATMVSTVIQCIVGLILYCGLLLLFKDFFGLQLFRASIKLLNKYKSTFKNRGN